jgi:hypothetical protein
LSSKLQAIDTPTAKATETTGALRGGLAAQCSGDRTDNILAAFGGAIICLSFFIFVPALQPFAFGIWYQSEPVIAALFACGSAATICLAAMAILGYPVSGALTHPLTLVTGALALWSAVSSLAAPLPMRSLIGPPQTGEGVLWQVALTALTALALAVWQRRLVRRAIVASAAVSGIVLLVLNVNEPIGSPWRPVFWPEFAAILGLFVIAIVVSDTSLRWSPALAGRIAPLPLAGRLSSGPASLRITAAVLLGGLIIATSSNKTAMAIAVLVIPGLTALSLLTGKGKLWRTATVTAAIAIIFAVPAGMYWLGSRLDLESPLSRWEMIRVALEALRSDPMLLLHGAGWGSYNDILYRFLEQVRDVRVESETWQPSLDIMGGGAFHTHNSYLEAIISTGLPGGVLLLALPVTAILYARRRSNALLCAVWVVVAGLLAAWFTLPEAVPFQAAALAATAGGLRRPSIRREPASPGTLYKRALYASIAVLAALVLMTASVMTVRLALDAQRVLANMRSGGAVDRSLPPWLLSDHGQGGAHLWWLTLDLTNRLATKGRSGAAFSSSEVYWFESLMRAVDRHVAELPSSLRLKSLMLIMRDELATEMGDPQFDRLREWEVPTWSQKLMALRQELPERSDLAAPFLDTLVQSNNTAVAIKFGNELLLRNPDDPVALWFTGIAMVPTTEWSNLGRARMVRAMDTGIERLIPLSPDVRKMLHGLRRD